MAKRVFRKFEAFAMHAHHDTPATYRDLFQKLESLQRNERIITLADDLIVGFPIVESSGNRFFLQVVEGDNSSPLVLNTETGRTRENILGDAEVLSHATHVAIDPDKRRAAVEFVMRGAKAGVISGSIEALLRERFEELASMRFELAPVVRKNFISEINKFERIREASLRVTRPNASWSDRYTELSEFMEESDGDKVEVGVKAGRSQKLSKNSGIVGVIKDVVRDNQPYLDDAKVIGMRPDEETETTIHARKHVLHTRTAVSADDAGVPLLDDIKSKLFRFLGLL